MKVFTKKSAILIGITLSLMVIIAIFMKDPSAKELFQQLTAKGGGGGDSQNYYTVSSGNWNSQGNWQDRTMPGTIIPLGDTVFIRHDITYPLDLTVEGVIVIESGSLLSNNGNKDITISSGASIFIYGDVECINLTIDTGAALTVYGTIKVSGDYTNNGTVTVETTEQYTGNLMVEGGIQGNSSFSFKRHIKADGWHYFASPMSNATTNVLWGGAVYSYVENSKSWKKHVANETLVPMKGYDVYFVNGSKTVVFEGNFNTGPQSISLTATSGTGDGYNLVGNPYASSINWDAISGWTKTNVDDAIYVWDDDQQNITTYIEGVGTNGATNIIPPTMAFFVKCNSTSGGTLSMTEAVQLTDKEKFRSKTPNNVLKLQIKNKTFTDETAIRFSEYATENYERAYDAIKMYSYNVQVPQIYTKTVEDFELAVNTVPYKPEGVSIPVYLTAKVEGEYEFSIDISRFEFDLNVYLEDKETSKIHDLQSGSYKFSTSTVADNDRFILHFMPLSAIAGDPVQTSSETTSGIKELTEEDFNIYSSDKAIYIKADRQISDGKIFIFSINGKELETRKYENNTTNIIPMEQQPTGYYIVTVIEGDFKISKKVYIK